MGESLSGLEGQGILYIGRPLSNLAESNIFSLQRVVLATVATRVAGDHHKEGEERGPAADPAS